MYHVTKKKMILKDLENNSQIILYQTDEGKTRVEVKMWRVIGNTRGILGSSSYAIEFDSE